ncbi:MAG TPA: hypothetical protein VE988_29910 [Gemmataceae bacterium]|nr:hypothetical protein [Gemmataceae bacterium]
MADQNVPPLAKPVVNFPGQPWFGFLGAAMLLAGCVCAFLSGRDFFQDKLALLTAAAVFIPLGSLGCAVAYTAQVKAALIQRIEELERRLRDKENGKGSA